MAKIHLTQRYNQEENLSVVASLGLLICMVLTIVGIKLWWFKHRLSFEQTNTQTSDAGSSAAAVIVPRRSKQQKYKKDKRYSQQIYDSVEVHGVFRQKVDDDFEIQRPQQLPPVRIRQLSESKSPPIVAPPRTKKRDQVHSTAFEDLEIVATSTNTTSSSDLTTITESNTKISLTFEEFEKQFKLKELKAKDPASPSSYNEVIAIPVPPLRLNRSSSAMIKPEKTQHILKSSQSITVPELHKEKIIEKRTADIARSTEDLTKLDDFDRGKLFQNIGERRLTGYVKYEEVDSDLQEQYEKELNAAAEAQAFQFPISHKYKSPSIEPALKALRNESIIYNNDFNDVQSNDVHNFNKKYSKLNEPEGLEYKKEDCINHIGDLNKSSSFKTEDLFSKDQRSSEYVKDSHHLSPKLNEERPTEFSCIKEQTAKGQHYEKGDTTINPSITKEVSITTFSKETEALKEGFQKSPEVVQTSQNISRKGFADFQKYEPEYDLIKERNAKEIVKEKTEFTKINQNENYATSSSFSLQEDFDNQFCSWPQFEEKIETPKVNVRRFNNQDLNRQSSFEEAYDLSIYFNVKENTNGAEEHFTLNQKKPMGSESPDLKDMKEWQEDFNSKFYKQVRSFITTENFTNLEPRVVTFDSIQVENSENKNQTNMAIKERRPTGFVRRNEYYVTYNDDSDEDLPASQRFETDSFQSNVEIVEIHSKLNLEGKDFSITPDKETEKLVLNQTRTTEMLSPLNCEETCNKINLKEDSKDALKAQEKCNDTEAQQEAANSDIKQRRPTGYSKNLEVLDVIANKTSNNKQTQHSAENKISYNSHTVKFQEEEQNFSDCEDKPESLLTQRRPTGYVRKEELKYMDKHVDFQINSDEASAYSSKENEALNQRRPTGFIRKSEIAKQINFYSQESSDEDEKLELGNEQLKQQKLNELLRKEKELKCLNQPAPIYHPKNENKFNKDFDNQLWQEMARDIEDDYSSNCEAEFAKIRHSYEVNEADFLELKDELYKLPTNSPKPPEGFGKSIEDDWDNFEELKHLQSPQEVKITFSDDDLSAKASILKDFKVEEDIQPKPRKSKVTFDFKTDERVIPARKIHNYSQENSDYENDDADLHDKAPSSIPPKPMQRVSNINYNNKETTLTSVVTIPTTISLFGSQISQEDNDVEDSWSAIRKHRNFTLEQQSPSTASTSPKSCYRNPMAQLAIQRAKEVRSDMDGYKSRSLNNKKSKNSKRPNQTFLNLSPTDYEATEA